MNKLLERYVSIKAEIVSITIEINISITNLIPSYLIFSLRLSFIIDLKLFIPLTAKKKIAGNSNILLKNIIDVTSISPFPVPITAIAPDIVYPIENPLFKIIKYIPGLPMIDTPRNAIIAINSRFFFIILIIIL